MKPTVISLFTGIGGLDFGFEAAGFRTAVAVELDAVCVATIRGNRRWRVLEGDVHHITSDEILEAAGLRRGGADILVGGPPCQPFSKSGYWASGDARRMDDPRAGTLGAFLRVLRDTRPRSFLLENVRGLAYKGKDEGLRSLIDGVNEINRVAGTNYKIHCATLNAAEFGVPQVRERVFLVASRDGRPFEFPRPTHGSRDSAGLFPSALEPVRTAWDAIGDLPDESQDPALQVKGRWGELLPSIPEGENYLWHTSRGGGRPLFGWRRRYWTFLLKLAKARPAWTIQAQPGTATGPFHWNNRRLSAVELCRIQTFPAGLSFDCGRGDVQRMLGNAVPSLLAEVLARAIHKQLLDGRSYGTRPTLMPPDRGTPPSPQRARQVARKYLDLVGEHSAHPGTGRGSAAALRSRNKARRSPSTPQRPRDEMLSL